MGNQKIIPITSYSRNFSWNLLIQNALNQTFPELKDEDMRIWVVNTNPREYKTEHGVRVGSYSTAHLPQMIEMKPYSFTSPPF